MQADTVVALTKLLRTPLCRCMGMQAGKVFALTQLLCTLMCRQVHGNASRHSCCTDSAVSYAVHALSRRYMGMQADNVRRPRIIVTTVQSFWSMWIRAQRTSTFNDLQVQCHLLCGQCCCHGAIYCSFSRFVHVCYPMKNFLLQCYVAGVQLFHCCLMCLACLHCSDSLVLSEC